MLINAKIFFKCKKINLKSNDINIENDIQFNDSFNNFIKENNNIKFNLNPSFKKSEEILMNYFYNFKNKLKWILFSFIKWRHHFLLYKFVILQNKTYNMKNPAILDIKLGYYEKISKDKKI